VSDDLYDGVPVEDLPIDFVYVPDPVHLRRSLRYSGAVDIAPEHAIEAALDPRRMVARYPGSRNREAIRIAGRSRGMGRVLIVVVLPDDHPPSGVWRVATAWPADRRTRAIYAERA
jgi:hypothetical protein